MDNEKTKDSLLKIYQALNLTPKESQKNIEELAGVQQVAVLNELLKDLGASEIEAINKDSAAGANDELYKKIIETHKNDPAFMAKAQAAAKRILDQHIAYLKTRGDDAQKAKIAEILA